ncbi:MAG: PaaX family transcriptional regulator C-terminal domain-containing protein [Tetrasphaera sp.]
MASRLSPPGRLPSVQAGSARATLLNAFGEFTLDAAAQPPTTGALLRTLGEVGIGHHAARQAVTRCAQGGWISGLRQGRQSRWAVTGAGRELLSDGIESVEALGVDGRADAVGRPAEWDGRWLVLVGSVPQDRRAVRERFYRALRWNGFGSPMPGLWLSARRGRRSRIAESVRRCGLEESVTAFVGGCAEIGLSEEALVEQAWDLDEIDARYAQLVDRHSAVSAATAADCLIALLHLDQELQFAPSWDPQLPTELAPGRRARADAARLLNLRATWLPQARDRWQSLQTS